ncbi:MAG: hypothetical protein ABMB14_26750, partial [Myxococcota bacterium]
MASGDAQRVWFPEMVDELRRDWSTSLTWDEVVRLCGEAMALRTRIRQERGILPPRTRCPHCGQISQADIPGISVRSLLFALRNDGQISETELARLDRSWKKHRAAHGLDAYGRARRGRPAGEVSSCSEHS